jgi:hypothetical protein
MKPIILIENYRDQHAGKSSFLDKQLDIAEQAINDSKRNLDRGDKEFALVNLYFARQTMTKLLEALPAPDAFRRILIDIYAAIDNQICDIQGVK